MFVDLSVKVTVAPATAEPVGSVIVPSTVPAVCENSGEGVKTITQNNAARSRATRLLDIQLPPGWAQKRTTKRHPKVTAVLARRNRLQKCSSAQTTAQGNREPIYFAIKALSIRI